MSNVRMCKMSVYIMYICVCIMGGSVCVCQYMCLMCVCVMCLCMYCTCVCALCQCICVHRYVCNVCLCHVSICNVHVCGCIKCVSVSSWIWVSCVCVSVHMCVQCMCPRVTAVGCWWFYVLATSMFISGRVPTCANAHLWRLYNAVLFVCLLLFTS